MTTCGSHFQQLVGTPLTSLLHHLRIKNSPNQSKVHLVAGGPLLGTALVEQATLQVHLILILPGLAQRFSNNLLHLLRASFLRMTGRISSRTYYGPCRRTASISNSNSPGIPSVHGVPVNILGPLLKHESRPKLLVLRLRLRKQRQQSVVTMTSKTRLEQERKMEKLWI